MESTFCMLLCLQKARPRRRSSPPKRGKSRPQTPRERCFVYCTITFGYLPYLPAGRQQAAPEFTFLFGCVWGERWHCDRLGYNSCKLYRLSCSFDIRYLKLFGWMDGWWINIQMEVYKVTNSSGAKSNAWIWWGRGGWGDEMVAPGNI